MIKMGIWGKARKTSIYNGKVHKAECTQWAVVPDSAFTGFHIF